MPNEPTSDPYGSFNFLVEIDGITRAAFREASGLDSSIDILEYREGGSAVDKAVGPIRKLRGQTHYSNIVLKWGITNEEDKLYEWHLAWARGDADAKRKTGSIVLIDHDGTEKIRWNFQNAWPAKWTGPSFNAEGKDIAIETLELAHEGLERA